MPSEFLKPQCKNKPPPASPACQSGCWSCIQAGIPWQQSHVCCRQAWKPSEMGTAIQYNLVEKTLLTPQLILPIKHCLHSLFHSQQVFAPPFLTLPQATASPAEPFTSSFCPCHPWKNLSPSPWFNNSHSQALLFKKNSSSLLIRLFLRGEKSLFNTSSSIRKEKRCTLLEFVFIINLPAKIQALYRR